MSGGFSSGFSSGFAIVGSVVPPATQSVMNGFSTNTMNIGSNVAAAHVWLYDPKTGNNVFQGNEYQNLSQFPVQNGNFS